MAPDWNTTIMQLFVCMAKVAHHALDCGWRNCGAYIDSVHIWLWPLHYHFCRDEFNGGTQQVQTLFPHELITELSRCRDAGLLTGDLRILRVLVTEMQRLRDTNDAAEPAKVHGADAPDVEHVQGTPSSAHPDLLSTSRPSSPVLQHFPQMEQHVATIASGSAEFIPDEPLSPSQELDRHSSTSDADPICAPRVSPVPASSSSLDTPKISVPVFDTPASSHEGPAPPSALLPLEFGEISTSTVTVITQEVANGTLTSRDVRITLTREDAGADTAQDNIELHDLGSQTIHAHSQDPLVEDERKHAGYTTTFSTDDSSAQGPSAVPPDTNDFVRDSPTFAHMSIDKHTINQMIQNNEEPNSHQASASPSASFASAIPQSDSPPTHPPSSSPEPSAPPRDGAGCSLDALSSELSLDDGTTPDVGACRPADLLFVDDPGDVPLPFASKTGSDVGPRT